jgi:D-alanyl-lipoteichoic acid acyltransferase DltB (MBOAT superfamily)
MIFTSYTYLAFLAVTFAIYWSLPRSWRNTFLIVMSYAFYCSWRWQYGFLLAGVSLFTWRYGAFLADRSDVRRWLGLGIAVELLPLIYFKYTPFLADNVNGVAGLLRARPLVRVPEILLPLGISFFTFQGIAYLVDVVSGAERIRRPRDFFLYKAFWPQLIAGPIVRPDEIREQIESDRQIDYADVAAGMRRILDGMFKKGVLADTLAPLVDSVFSPTASPAALDVVAATLGFGMQIYFDFSGYSDIAIGSARLFGFRFPENFDLPYAARSWQQFWGRWHMSLTRWIRDYVFTPMTFASRARPRMTAVWLLLAMALCGLWHGARWTFVAWGIIHGVLLLLNHTVLRRPLAEAERAAAGSLRAVFAWALVMSTVTLAWLFFRAQSLAQAGSMLSAVVHAHGGIRPAVMRENGLLVIGCLFVALMAYQILARPTRLIISRFESNSLVWRPLAGAYYCAVVVATIIFESNTKAFVYFQF